MYWGAQRSQEGYIRPKPESWEGGHSQASIGKSGLSHLSVAIDDVGADYSSLQAIVELERDYLKFDIALVCNLDKSLIKRSLLETLVEFSQKIGAVMIAEVFEAESEVPALREMSVSLGQGCHLAPPVVVTQEGVAAAR